MPGPEGGALDVVDDARRALRAPELQGLACVRQGLTLVRSAQPDPFLTQNTP